MRLPDWALFCERCGASVEGDGAQDEPLQPWRLDDTPTQVLSMDMLRRSEAGPSDAEGTPSGADDAALEAESEPQELEEPLPQDGAAAETQEEADDAPASPEDSDADATVVYGATDGGQDRSDTRDDESEEGDAASDDADADAGEPDGEDEPDSEADTSEAAADEEAAEEPADERDAEGDDAATAQDDESAESLFSEESVFMPMRHIDVGENNDGWREGVRHVSDPWSGRARPSERRSTIRANLPIPPMLIVAMAAIVLGLVIASLALHTASNSVDDKEPSIGRQTISESQASAILSGLNGWWTTSRELDGRYWYFEDGLMETYAADGNLAKERQINPALVEHMDSGPGDIAEAGYFLRDVGYFLVDGDPDTMRAITQEGEANEDGNLLRTTAPSFAEDGKGPKAKGEDDDSADASDHDEADDSEYMLPESDERVYEESELQALTDHDLFIARNEIFARHGYTFQPGELSSYFESKSWYTPSDAFNEGELNEFERQNVDAILQVERARGSQYV